MVSGINPDPDKREPSERVGNKVEGLNPVSAGRGSRAAAGARARPQRLEIAKVKGAAT